MPLELELDIPQFCSHASIVRYPRPMFGNGSHLASGVPESMQL
jgi:hypothetical protein